MSAALTAAQVAEIRQWIGESTPPTDDDLATAFERLGTTGEVALEVLRGRYATALEGPAKWEVTGDFSVDNTATLAAMAKQVKALEGLTPGSMPTMTVHSLTRADPWR